MTDHGSATRVELLPVPGLPEFRPGDDLGAALATAAPWLRDGDIVVVTSKVVSKCEGRIVPALTPDDPEWQEKALCAQTDPEAFFPEKGGSTREAKRICLGCEVRDACLDYALAHDERFGIWGGLSERERRRLKRGII